MRKGRRIVLVTLIALLMAVVGVALSLYLMVRHRPGLYRPPTSIPEAQRRMDWAALDHTLRLAGQELRVNGAFTAQATQEQLNSALYQYEQEMPWRRRLDLPVDLRDVQLVIQPDLVVAMALAPSAAGSVVVSVYARIVTEEGEPRLRVDDVRAGSLGLPRRRLERLIEKIETWRPHFRTTEGPLRLTRLILGEGAVTLQGIKEAS
jgi:cytochrome c-type biogenesis protein CcmE